MFYCDPCRKKNNWPETFFRSYGPCEICGLERDCNDTPSKFLPIQPSVSKKEDILEE